MAGELKYFLVVPSFVSFLFSSHTILHTINQDEINLTIRPSEEFVEKYEDFNPSHATITIQVSGISSQCSSNYVLMVSYQYLKARYQQFFV